jgi:hypothetical protein
MPNVEHEAEMAEGKEVAGDEEFAEWRDHHLGTIFSPARVAHFIDTLPAPRRKEWLERFQHLTQHSH